MENRSSGVSTLGLISGLAGLLTATAALVGLLVQFGVIGGGGSSAKGAGAPSEQSPADSEGSGGTAATPPRFTVKPSTLSLSLLKKQDKVVVSNTGDTPISVQQPTLEGSGAGQFEVADESCTGDQVGGGETCDVTVAFSAAAGQFSAKLVIRVKGASAFQVDVRGSTL